MSVRGKFQNVVEEELPTLPEHLSVPSVFSEVRVTRSLVLCVDRYLSFCPFYFGLCVVNSSSIYGFWLPLWYLQAFDHYIVFPSLIMASDYPCGIFKLLTIILSYFFYYDFWLPLWYLQTFDHYIVFPSSIMTFDYPFGTFKNVLITSLVPSKIFWFPVLLKKIFWLRIFVIYSNI